MTVQKKLWVRSDRFRPGDLVWFPGLSRSRTKAKWLNEGSAWIILFKEPDTKEYRSVAYIVLVDGKTKTFTFRRARKRFMVTREESAQSESDGSSVVL